MMRKQTILVLVCVHLIGGGNTKLWLAWKSSSVGVNDDTENKNLLFFYLIMVRCRVLNGFV